MIQTLDLKAQHQIIKKELFMIFEEVYDKVAFSGSPESLASFISGMFLVYSLENKMGEFTILTDIDFDPYDPDIPPVN